MVWDQEQEGKGDEGGVLAAPERGHFSLPNPDFLLGIALRSQIAQKIHACTYPHDPPDARNDPARDVVDLLLPRALAGRKPHACAAAGGLRCVVRRTCHRCPPPATRRVEVAPGRRDALLWNFTVSARPLRSCRTS